MSSSSSVEESGTSCSSRYTVAMSSQWLSFGKLGFDSPCGLINQLHKKANPKVAAKQTKTVCLNFPTVALYIALKMVGPIIRANACKSPVAPRSCPVLSGGTCFVSADPRVGDPIPPTDATTPE